jgi:CheY-like chemotaxis protein
MMGLPSVRMVSGTPTQREGQALAIERRKVKSQPVLIVDDNASNLRLIQAILDAEGCYTVKSAMDAEEALQVLQDWQPNLILMDIQMPGIDGLELTRRLKADPRYRSIVIVALTAYAMLGDEDKALAAGCDGYITKPIDSRVLPDVIERYLKRVSIEEKEPPAKPKRQSGARGRSR